MSLLKGIDTSEHNAWPFSPTTQKYYNECDFIIMRASVNTRADKTFKRAVAKAMQDGKLCGAYHYYAEGGPEAQADVFLDTVGSYVGKIVLCLDWEGANNPSHGKRDGAPNRFIQRIIQKSGVTPILYTGKGGLRGDCADLRGKCKIWFAGWPNPNQTSWDEPNFHYDISPWSKESDLLIWQYSTTGGKVDRDLGYLTRDQWAALASGDPNATFATLGYSGVSKIAGPDPRDTFIEEAAKHVGPDGHSWVQSMTSIGGQAWCAATMCAIAKACGFDGKIMPGADYGAGRFGYKVVEEYGGTFIEGGSGTTPEKGDFCEFYPGSKASAGLPAKYKSHHIGVVERVEGNTVHTIEGNHGNTYTRVKRSKGGVGWYARPDWSKVGGTLTAVYSASTSLYDTSSTRADATIREVCYLGRDGEPSINKTDTRLCVINYTSLLAEIVGAVGRQLGGSAGYSSSGSPDNIDGLPAQPREIVKYLIGRGLNTAAAIGVVANIRAESNFRLDAVGDHGTSFGLCQWHLGRGDAMKAACGGGNNYKNNMTGQLDYLWSELESGYKTSVLDPLKTVPNTLEGAKQAVEIFVRHFEIPQDKEGAIRTRSKYAEEYWSSVVVNSSSSYSNYDSSSSITVESVTQSSPINGRQPTKSETIPSPLPGGYPNQSGIIADYTNYSYWFSRWAYSCRRVADVWAAKGKQSNNGVATIDGYYVVAMRPRFGDVGDLVQVVLEGGTKLNCILGDTKGSDAQSEYGHLYSGKVSLVEWEAVGPSHTSKVSDLTSRLKTWGIQGKKVISVTNYGKYC